MSQVLNSSIPDKGLNVSESPGTVIVGAGQAGCEAAFALRQLDSSGRIVLVGDDSYLPYRRPPLSKQFLASDASAESLNIKPLAAFEKARIEIVTGTSALRIDRHQRQIWLDDGHHLEYRNLILATGGYARPLQIPGAPFSNIFYLRTINDALAIRTHFKPAKKLVVVGGGYIGLEVAALAKQAGLEVTLLVCAPRLLMRVASPLISAFYEKIHRQAGIDIHLNAVVQSFEGVNERVEYVMCADGKFATDFVVVGIGLIPHVELALNAGLEVDNGIVTDSHHRTSDPNIFAIGDCANTENPFLRVRARLESVPNALEQGKRVAQIITGQPPSEMQPPWFWSDQYDVKLQMVGLSSGHDDCILRGDPETRSFLAFYLKDGVVIAVDAVNRTQDFTAAKTIVANRMAIDANKLALDGEPLKSLLT